MRGLGFGVLGLRVSQGCWLLVGNGKDEGIYYLGPRI